MQTFSRFLALAAVIIPLGQAAPVSSTSIPGKWIIRLKPEADIATITAHKNSLARRGVGDIKHEYGFGSFKGYSGAFDAATIDELKNLPEVLSVEPDSIMSIDSVITQSNVGQAWGIARISSRTPGATDYVFDSTAGEGTFSYVIDTGIRLTHTEFGGRAEWGFNAVENSTDTDNDGHGTHVSGTIGGSTYGVAKKTTLIAVKTFEGSTGSVSTILSGLDWAINDIVSRKRTSTAVINMSAGGLGSTTWDEAITAAWEQGVLLVCSSGNSDADTADWSPARSPETITVGNSQSDDSRYTTSNWGPTVNIFAPGTKILSSYFHSDIATEVLTGTSMASPHVAGLVSYIRGLEGPLSAEAVKARVLELATPDIITDPKNSTNLLAYNGIK
ncbi:subtilisin-like protease-like protein [Massarina eburnea CBS 473.64]|uniref:Subtilisin-like protease-like protein n=1 Tax=Massarina eburnea CBS 473.64 TaxID=1395130 RepID=A0A6A6S1C1_9PLEO|nr:subtilisin-like protease-like protein [Massarina eburnea CBS 473.64]